jgi:hypothetical protein
MDGLKTWFSLRIAVAAIIVFVPRWSPGQEKSAPESEPVYHGRTLSYWLFGIANGSLASNEEYVRAEEAVRAIGTNAIPTLLWMMSDPQKELNVAGLQAFVIAKTNLASAVPELVGIYERAVTADSMRWTAGVFGILGESARAAAPALVRRLNHPNRDVRRETAGALMHIRGDATVVIPALKAVLGDPRCDIKDYALNALAQYEAEARSALPEVLAIYRGEASQVAMDSDPKRAADRAIGSIAPEELEGVVEVENETLVRLIFPTALELYAEYSSKASLAYWGKERSVIIWTAPGKSMGDVTGGPFKLYRPVNPAEEGAFLQSDFEVEHVAKEPRGWPLSLPDIRYYVADGKLFVAARDQRGRPLKIRQVRRDFWDEWLPEFLPNGQ